MVTQCRDCGARLVEVLRNGGLRFIGRNVVYYRDTGKHTGQCKLCGAPFDLTEFDAAQMQNAETVLTVRRDCAIG